MEAWEQSKENVQPIKRGRSTKGLNDALATNQDSCLIDSIIADFEKQIKVSKITGSDLLEIYIRYFKWSRDRLS